MQQKRYQYKKTQYFVGTIFAIVGICVSSESLAQEPELGQTAEKEQRIEHVVNGLLPETAFRNRYDEPASLTLRMAHYKTPGVSIAVVNNGEIEWARGFGVREWGKSDSITETTLFQVASISKPIFALGIMRLVQQGRLDLDEDINTYLKSWKVPTNGSWQPRITLRQILSHSAGLTVSGFPGYLRSEEIPNLVEILEGKYSSNTAPILVNIIPGFQSRYSGGGITLAQLVMMDVVGKPFPEIMRELVFDPLGMEYSTYEQPLPEKWATQAATAHPWKIQAIVGKWHVYPEMAAAGLWTTASDLARVGIELQRALKGKSDFLSQEIVSQMLAPQTGDNNGMGFFIQGEGESIRFGHDGWNEGFVAHLTMFQNIGMGTVIMVNSNEGYPIMPEIERAIAQEYDWPDFFPKEKTAIPLSEDALQDFVGEYITEEGISLIVTRIDTVLSLKAGNQLPIELYPEDETAFFMTAVNADVTFEKTEDGEITGLQLHQNGKQIAAEKKGEEDTAP